MKTRVALFVALIAAGGMVTAQARTYRIDIPPQPLDSALEDFADQSELQVVYLSEIVQGIDSPGFTGEGPLEDVLPALLEGSGLAWRFENERTVSIVAPDEDKHDSAAGDHSESTEGNGPPKSDETAPDATPDPDEVNPSGSPQNSNVETSSGQPQATTEDDETAAAIEAALRLEEEERKFAGEIVVTARKREEKLQDIPIAATVLTEANLIATGVQSITDLDKQTVNLNIVSEGSGRSQIILRGIPDIGLSMQASAPVGIYLDEIPMAVYSWLQGDVAMFDVERVEVLRGPQGTLFGEGSMGGTIRIITAKPNLSDTEFKLDAGTYYTTDGEPSYSGRAALSVPLVENRLAVRFNVGYAFDGGWVDAPAYEGKNVNEEEVKDFRASLRWAPSPKALIDLVVLGKDVTVGGTPYSFDDLTENLVNPSPLEDEYTAGNLTIRYDFGSFDLVSATSVVDRDTHYAYDSTRLLRLMFGVPFEQVSFDSLFGNRIVSQEFRLVSSTAGKLQWTTGVFYKNSERTSIQTLPTVPELPFQLFASDEIFGITHRAVFGELNYQITDSVGAVVGMRYFREDRDSESLFEGLSVGPAPVESGQDTTDESVSPRFSVVWQPSSATTWYATASKGFRGGGNNDFAQFLGIFVGTEIKAPATFRPEQLWSYELGLKNTWRTVALTGAVYFIDWTDVHVEFRSPTGFPWIDNAAAAHNLGAELEMLAFVTQRFDLGLGAALNRCELDEDIVDFDGTVIAPKGNRMPFIPEFAIDASAEYRAPLGRNVAAFRIQYTHKSDTYSEIQNIEESRNEAWDLVDLRLTYEAGAWSLAFFVNNVFDERAEYDHRPDDIGEMMTLFVRPLNYGVVLRARF